MKGFLVVNHFLQWDKFDVLHAMLVSAFKDKGAELVKVTNVELMSFNEACGGASGQNRSGAPNACYPPSLTAKGLNKPDFVLFWDKDIRLAKRLEAYGIRVFNSADSLEACDDKALTAIKLIGSGIRMPETIIAPKTFKPQYPDTGFLDGVAAAIGFPMIVKECFGSFGAQVYLVNTTEELRLLVEKIGAKPMLFQEFVKSSAGKDMRIHVVGGKVTAAVMRIAAAGEYRANATNGGRMFPYSPTGEEAYVAVKSCELLGADFAGVDILFGETPLLCEVNTNAHFKNLFDATGVNVADNIAEYVVGVIEGA